MAGLFNDAIDLAEAQILKIDEDYFLTKATLTLVQDASDITLPSTIYAQKIRSVIYKNGSTIYEVRRLRDPKEFLARAVINDQVNSTEDYRYFLRLDAGSSQAVMELVPPAYESGAYLTMWFIRNAARIPLIEEGSNRAAQIATVIDIPEWRMFLEQYVKMRLHEKLKDPAAEASSAVKVKALSEAMVDALTNRTPDRDDVLEGDTSFYEEMN